MGTLDGYRHVQFWPEAAPTHVIALSFSEVDGRPECVGLEIWGAPVRPWTDREMRSLSQRWKAATDTPYRRARIVDTDTLRSVPLGAIVRDVVGALLPTLEALASHPLGVAPSADPERLVDPADRTGRPPEWAVATQRHADDAVASSGRRPGRPRQLQRSHYEEVALVYLGAQRAHQPPTKAVHEHYKDQPEHVGLSYATAADWVKTARNEYGLLPAPRSGRPKKGTR